MVKKILKTFLYVILGLIVLYLIGPAPESPDYSAKLPEITVENKHLDNYIAQKEKVYPVKPDNEARIVWANDSLKNVTDYVIIYLHGFGACQEEGNPVHKDIAKRFGCNLLLTRLSEHGLNSANPMLDLTVTKLWESTLTYYSIGKKLGRKVILMSTSSGGTLALKMASVFPDIYALILYSPNIEIDNKNAWVLNNHWGTKIATYINGSNEIVSGDTSRYYTNYWYSHYRIEAAAQLQELVESSMKPNVFKKVKQPVLLLYYFKDSLHRDNVVKVSAMLKMFNLLGTASGAKVKAALPEAGIHVIANGLRAKDIVSVENYTSAFFINQLHISPVY